MTEPNEKPPFRLNAGHIETIGLIALFCGCWLVSTSCMLIVGGSLIVAASVARRAIQQRRPGPRNHQG